MFTHNDFLSMIDFLIGYRSFARKSVGCVICSVTIQSILVFLSEFHLLLLYSLFFYTLCDKIDAFEDANDAKGGNAADKVHVRVQQRNGHKLTVYNRLQFEQFS